MAAPVLLSLVADSTDTVPSALSVTAVMAPVGPLTAVMLRPVPTSLASSVARLKRAALVPLQAVGHGEFVGGGGDGGGVANVRKVKPV